MIEDRTFRWVRRVGLTLLTVFVSLPLYVMVSASVQPLVDVRSPFAWIPRHITLAPYRDAFTTLPLARYLTNSAVVAGCTTALAVLFAVPAAYALARFRFRGARPIGLALLATQFAPGMLFLLPLFLLYAQLDQNVGLKLIGTYPGLVLVDLTFALPFSIWMLAGYFRELPRAPEESATALGAGPLTVLRRVVLPSSGAAIAAVGTLAFAVSWGEVLFASVLTDDATLTLPVGLPGYVSGTVPYWNQAMAASMIAGVPVVAVFVVLRRFLLGGLARAGGPDAG